MQRSDGWIWLFPLTYLLHIAEEYWGRFYIWLSRVAGVDLSREDFLIINAIAFVVMTGAVFAASIQPAARLVIAGFGAIVFINGLLHLGGSIVTQSYSPGVVTGTLLWLPLGVYALRRVRQELPAGQFAAGVVIGLLLHGIVSLVAFFG